MNIKRLLITSVAATLLSCALPTALAANYAMPKQMLHERYINGNSDGLFQPNKSLTRAEFAQIVYNLLYQGENTSASFFDDVALSKWYATAVNLLAEKGIVSTNSDSFAPERAATRAEVVQILSAIAGVELDPDDAEPFDDVPESHWAYNAILLARQQGWVVGNGGNKFQPDQQVTRAQAVTMINRFMGFEPDSDAIRAHTEVCPFPDVPATSWFFEQVMEAAVSHTLEAGGTERWKVISTAPIARDPGFHLFGDQLYLVKEDGMFANTPQSGIFESVPYTCNGVDGTVKVDGTELELANRNRILIQSGGLLKQKGAVDYNGALYYIQSDYSMLRNEIWNNLYFGEDGRYTTGNDAIDAFVNQIVASETTSKMTQVEKLRACYNYIFRHVNYQSNNNHVPRGADPSTWTETYMLRLMERGKGNCYCYASEMYYLARRLGYDAKAISGGVHAYNTDHGWVEIEIDGKTYAFDPELESKHYSAPGHMFMKQYNETPWVYHKE